MEGVLSILGILVACGVAAAIAYKAGQRNGTESIEVTPELPLTIKKDDEPLPEGFNPKKHGSALLDEPVPLVESAPTYYEYDDNGEATGETHPEVDDFKPEYLTPEDKFTATHVESTEVKGTNE